MTGARTHARRRYHVSHPSLVCESQGSYQGPGNGVDEWKSAESETMPPLLGHRPASEHELLTDNVGIHLGKVHHAIV
jgi:hypothetical protein